MRKLILMMLATLCALSNFANDESYINDQQFNAVVISIPSVVKIEKGEGYSVNVSKTTNIPCSYIVKEDTLYIKAKYYDEDVYELKHTEMTVQIKHPDPDKIFNNLVVTKDYYFKKSTSKDKSGNQN